MFPLSILFLIVAFIAAILSFGFLEGQQIDTAYFVFMAAMSIFSISGLIGVFISPWAYIRPPLIPLDGRRTAPD